MKISYDYSGLIAELEQDIKDGFVKNDTIYTVRNDNGFIIDYYWDLSLGVEKGDEDKLEENNVYEILAEMREVNRII